MTVIAATHVQFINIVNGLSMKATSHIASSLILESAEDVLSKYSTSWQNRQRPRLRQFVEEIGLIYKPGGTVVDIGGGDGIRAAICANLGMKAYNVDFYELNVGGCDHMPAGFIDEFQAAVEVNKSFGVIFENADVIKWRTTISNIDVVMSFDALEHLHHSPRDLFHHLKERMVVGGQFFIGAPNAANILKRLRVLGGKNAFSRIEDFYYVPLFTGHVREPIVSDLYVIANDLNMPATVIGANWLGFSRLGPNSKLAKIADVILRPFPELCSDIYLLAQKQ